MGRKELNDIIKRRKRLFRMVDILYLSTIPSTLSNKFKPFEVFSMLSMLSIKYQFPINSTLGEKVKLIPQKKLLCGCICSATF